MGEGPYKGVFSLVSLLGILLIGYGFALYLSPVAHGAFKDLQFQIRNQFTNVLLREGVFNTVGKDMTVYLRSRSRNGARSSTAIRSTT